MIIPSISSSLIHRLTATDFVIKTQIPHLSLSRAIFFSGLDAPSHIYSNDSSYVSTIWFSQGPYVRSANFAKRDLRSSDEKWGFWRETSTTANSSIRGNLTHFDLRPISPSLDPYRSGDRGARKEGARSIFLSSLLFHLQHSLFSFLSLLTPHSKLGRGGEGGDPFRFKIHD